MSNPLAEYLSAIEARDAREKAHEEYINAYTKLADRTATLPNQAAPAADDGASTPPVSTKTVRPGTPNAKPGATLAEISSPSSLAQLRSELAATQRTRGELETQLSATNAELTALKASDTLQRQRIAQLEKVRANLERRGKDRVDELRGKGKFVEDIQDEMVALTLQLNMAEQEKESLKKENDDLTKRWVQKMEEEARRMNDRMGWDDPTGRRKGSRS
ncbi:autophagy-related protein 16 [Ampelomyces quisqualis]|uniref:Autophagy-related protein 16 n=1 Tax=Ampelomyces quisqualis TaxID=50730 RepID=A0A6A5QVH6_AMPQU|nr:autophagy-related protein 16 [Ampelomyces quisqualis]